MAQHTGKGTEELGPAVAERVNSGAGGARLELDGQELALLYEMVKAANIPGSVAEIFLRLQRKVNAGFLAGSARGG